MKTHSATLEEFKSKAELQNIKYYQNLYLTGKAKMKPSKAGIAEEKEIIDNFEYRPMEETTFNE